MLIYSPLEQFTIIPLIHLSNLSLFLLVIIIFLLLISFINPFLLQKHIDWWNINIKNISDHIFIILTLFLLILFSNLIGMIPYTLTITSQIIFVFSISIVVFISINWLGIKIHGINITYLFLPSGVPNTFVALISMIEILLYFVKVLSLTIRLSANMIAGHILMKILIYSFINIPLFSILIIPIVFLELMVAFLQAYVYLTLIISYYQDISLPH